MPDYFLLALVSTSSVATSTAGVDLEDAISLASRAYVTGNWKLVAAGVLMALVAAARQLNLLKLVPPRVIPWLAVGLACATSIALGIVEGQRWPVIISTGLVIGLSAIGSWETIGRLIQTMKRKIGVSPEEVEAEKKSSGE